MARGGFGEARHTLDVELIAIAGKEFGALGRDRWDSLGCGRGCKRSDCADCCETHCFDRAECRGVELFSFNVGIITN